MLFVALHDHFIHSSLLTVFSQSFEFLAFFIFIKNLHFFRPFGIYTLNRSTRHAF